MMYNDCKVSKVIQELFIFIEEHDAFMKGMTPETVDIPNLKLKLSVSFDQ